MTVWPFLSRVLRDGKEVSCQSAVARVVSHCQQAGLTPPTSDTSDYCRAHGKLAAAALRALSGEVAADMEQAADATWLWKGHLYPQWIDGFTFTMPDTPKNQVMMIALLRGRGVQACARKHQLRHSDFRRGERLGKYDHLITWTRPASRRGREAGVLASWMQLSCGTISAELRDDYVMVLLQLIAACEVANRPGRLEPRVLKRRRHGYPLMQKSRGVLRAELRHECT